MELTLSLSLATPELIIAVGAMVLLMIGVYSDERVNALVSGLAAALLIGAALWILLYPSDGAAFGGGFVSDPFSRFMKVLALVGSAVTLVMSLGFAKAEKFDKFEFPVLILLSTLGMKLRHGLADRDGIAFAFQNQPERSADIRLVVHDEDVARAYHLAGS